MLSNRWRNVLYIGVTNSLETRIWQHKAKLVRGFTKDYNCDQLVYFEIYERIEQAIAREKQLKGWRRAKKDALIARMNPELKDLSGKRSRTNRQIRCRLESRSQTGLQVRCHPEPPKSRLHAALTPAGIAAQDGRRPPCFLPVGWAKNHRKQSGGPSTVLRHFASCGGSGRHL